MCLKVGPDCLKEEPECLRGIFPDTSLASSRSEWCHAASLQFFASFDSFLVQHILHSLLQAGFQSSTGRCRPKVSSAASAYVTGEEGVIHVTQNIRKKALLIFSLSKAATQQGESSVMGYTFANMKKICNTSHIKMARV